ncbi:11898_t:CDS:2 [Cetraspora pellucida]|uniref:11898_t:CDS:1 n=1 Tax=Cetraspora pellucida TaxID=1433469 RepID=A0ACA9JWV1_9GLOM|nr:11898_t:CDS:2 [Cetraspora pellucida]
MDGFLLIDKPSGITSHKVIEIIRKKLNIKKVGHAGTLDPLTTGLLVIMLGKSTKLSNQLISQSKTYEVEMKLFCETDTGDITGRIVNQEKPRLFVVKQIQQILNHFNNYEYHQQPPRYSAIKIKGKKLYQYARQNIPVEIPLRLVKIKKIKLLNCSLAEGKIKLVVKCSKGTYIRSLVKDIAEKLGTVATVSQLRRISSGNFHINQALKLAEVKAEKIILREKDKKRVYASQLKTLNMDLKEEVEKKEQSESFLICPIRGPLRVRKYDAKGHYTEEYQRIRLIKYLLQKGYPKHQFLIEYAIPIGHKGHNTLRVDLVIKEQKKFICVAEVKKNYSKENKNLTPSNYTRVK